MVLHYTVQTFNSCTSRLDISQCIVVQTPLNNVSKNKPDTSMTHVAYESKVHLIVRSSMHPWPRNWVTTGRVVVYHARAARAGPFVQELNVSTVYAQSEMYKELTNSCSSSGYWCLEGRAGQSSSMDTRSQAYTCHLNRTKRITI